MDKKQIVMFAVMMMAMFFLFKSMPQSQSVIIKPANIADAQAMEKKAGNDKDQLKKVVDAYDEVAKTNKDTEFEAQARLQVAIIEETKLDDPVKHDHESKAVTAYKSIIQDFSPKTSPSGKIAEERLLALESKIDVRNSKDIGYKAIDALVALTGRNPKYSFAVALLLITLIVKIITTPLSHKQYQSMKEMQKIGPLVKQLQEKYKGDQKVLGEKTMELYKEHGVNPFASCLPLVIQMPILIGLYYKVILAYQFQFTKGTFLWIGSSLVNKLPAFYKISGIPFIGTKSIPVLATNLAMPDLLLLLLYTGSMIVSQKLTVVDPTQAEQQKMMAWMMPIMFMFIFSTFPSALMLYWLMFNVFSTAQQYYIMKPGLETAAVAAGPAEAPSGPVPSKVSKKK